MAATPTAAPILRENWFSDVTSPSRSRLTLCWIASSSDSIEKPIPAPTTKQDTSSRRSLEAAVNSDRPAKPPVISTLPMMVMRR